MESIRTSYKKYRKEVEKPLESPDYLKVCGEYNKFLVQKVIAGEKVTLPGGMGYLSVIGNKVKLKFGEDGKPLNLAPSWSRTKKLWDNNPEAKAKKQLVYITNEHTDGVRYKYVWSRNRVMATYKTLYSLRLTRTNKVILRESILNGNEYIIR